MHDDRPMKHFTQYLTLLALFNTRASEVDNRLAMKHAPEDTEDLSPSETTNSFVLTCNDERRTSVQVVVIAVVIPTDIFKSRLQDTASFQDRFR